VSAHVPKGEREHCEKKGVTHAPTLRVHFTGLERVARIRLVLPDFQRPLVFRTFHTEYERADNAIYCGRFAAQGLAQKLASGRSRSACGRKLTSMLPVCSFIAEPPAL